MLDPFRELPSSGGCEAVLCAMSGALEVQRQITIYTAVPWTDHAFQGFGAEEKDGALVTLERSVPAPRPSVPHDLQPANAAGTGADQCPDGSGDTSELCRSETVPAEAVSLPPGESPTVVNGGLRAAATVAVLTPFLLVHLVAVAVPMRFAYAVFVGKVETEGEDASFYDKVGGEGGDAPGVGACDAREQGVPGEPERQPNDGPSREAVDKGNGRSEESSRLLASSRPCADGEAAADDDRPKDDTQIGSNAPQKGVSEEGGRMTGGIEAVAGAIRRNLGSPELGIKRVDVYLPDFHTHGSIVVRRSLVSSEGRFVIDHMAAVLFD